MKKKLGLLVVLSFVISGSCNFSKEKILQNIQNGTEKLTLPNAAIPKFLKDAVIDISKIPKILADESICSVCNIVVNSVIVYRRTGADKDLMKTYLEKLCIVFSDWGPVACKGYVEIELGTILYIIDNKRNLTPERVCAIYFQKNKCKDPNAKKWKIPLPPAFPLSTTVEKQSNDSPVLNILQLTDIHYDPLYVPGSNAVCDEPLCCQSGIPTDPKNAAGYWGDYNVCDMPLHSVENLLNRIKEKHLKEIDFIYYTGDIISHKSWATNIEDNSNTLKKVYGLFAHVFGNTTVYPILGNHEPHPTDLFSSDNVTDDRLSTRWVFELSAQEWSRWLPEDTKITILKGGYYTVLVKPGFRIIALNSNVCFTSNSWLFYEDEDPYNQLAWLVLVLTAAEKNNEKVHILSHIPPGEILCHRQWSNQFRKIINRFASTISTQFNGHTHVDELKVFYDPDNSNRVINVAYNGASFTTFVGYNPNYRIYQIDNSNLDVKNYDQYIFNLTAANQNRAISPNWYKLYSFKEAYNLTDLTRNSFHRLMEKMSVDYDLQYQYFRFSVRDSDVQLRDGCDRKCLQQLVCYITAVETDLSVNC